MKVYLVAIRDFFVDHNTDYAMAVDLKDDLMLYESFESAEKKFEKLCEAQLDMFDCSVVLLSENAKIFSYNNEYGRRRVIEIVEKNINK
jgi:hypothetical protein